jgi:hypothetical protein
MREWTEEELRRVGKLRRSKKRLSWREIAREMDREVVDVRTTWRKRVKPRVMTPAPATTTEDVEEGDLWDEYKVYFPPMVMRLMGQIRRLGELSDEYDRVKWGVIGKVMGIDWETCSSKAKELHLS